VEVAREVGIVAPGNGLPRIPCARVPNAVTFEPLLVTAPLMFAFVVTVAALPEMFIETGEDVETEANVFAPVA
jgi:hypothetical protein